MSFPEILHKLRSRNWRELRLLPEALLLLAFMRLAVLLIPFQRTAGFLGLKPTLTSTANVSREQSCEADYIGWALRAMAFRTPWESACLTQALAGMIMLQRRGIPALLFLGVAKDGASPETMVAHAWLKCGNAIVTGKDGYERFTVLSTFTGKKCR
ncbi:MAG: lasso peptide biosynthesis B2 protein [Desulfuromonadaceae bacterium]